MFPRMHCCQTSLQRLLGTIHQVQSMIGDYTFGMIILIKDKDGLSTIVDSVLQDGT